MIRNYTFCKSFVETRSLPVKANDTYIVLISKKAKSETMMDLHPIALCNVLYKIAAKVYANRLKLLLDDLISSAQSVFVPSQLIIYNIMLAYVVHHYLKCKTQGRDGVAPLNVDMSKAYDPVEWCFLKAVLLKMGFGRKWVDILLEIVSSVKYHILHEQ